MGGSVCPYSNLFVLSDIVKQLREVRRKTEKKKIFFFCLFLFFFLIFSFTSFQAESLLVWRKLWRGKARAGGGGEEEDKKTKKKKKGGR